MSRAVRTACAAARQLTAAAFPTCNAACNSGHVSAVPVCSAMVNGFSKAPSAASATRSGAWWSGKLFATTAHASSTPADASLPFLTKQPVVKPASSPWRGFAIGARVPQN